MYSSTISGLKIGEGLQMFADGLLFKESIIHSAASAIATCDFEGRMTYCNPAFFKQWGFDGPKEVYGNFFWRYWLVETRVEEIMATLETTGAWTDEIKAMRKDGTLFDVQVSAATVSDINGNPVGLTSTSIDITHLKQAREALESERAFLSAVLDNIHEAIVICDAQGRLVRFNKAARRLHALPEQPVPSDQWANYYNLYQINGMTPLPLEDIPLFRALNNEHVQNAEIVVAPKNKKPHYLVCNGQALTDDRCRIIGAVVAMHDITERKQTEEALRNTERQMRLILDTVPALVWHKNRNGLYKQVNKAFCHTHGRSAEEFLGKTDYDVFPLELAAQYVAADCRVLTSGLPELGIEEPLQKPLGELGWSRKDKLVYRDADGNIAGTIGFAVDITEQKRAEAQILQLQKAESLGRMAGAVAHHYNNLLAIVMGNLELAMEDLPCDCVATKSLAHAMMAARRASDLAGKMLGYLGQTTASRKPLNLATLCRRALPDLRSGMPVHITLKADLPDPGPVAMADAQKIRQALGSLLINAWEAVDKDSGFVSVSIRTVSSAEIPSARRWPIEFQPEASGYACLEVKDTGQGIEEDAIGKIFDPFYSTKFIGRGMDLSVVLGTVKAHDGCITVETGPGRGSIFRVFLPLTTEADFRPKVQLRQQAAAI